VLPSSGGVSNFRAIYSGNVPLIDVAVENISNGLFNVFKSIG
jgi:hypothetical protein